MSSIIDALKKSDNNRTNEPGANNINQIKFGNEPPPKSRRGFWLLVVLLLLVASGVFAWTQGWHHTLVAKTKNMLGLDSIKSELAPSKTPVRTKTTNQKTNEKDVNSTTKPSSRNNNKLMPPKANEVKAKSKAVNQAKTEKNNKRKQQLEVIAKREAKKMAEGADTTKTEASKKDEIMQIKRERSSRQPGNEDVTQQKELMAKQNRKDLEPELKQDYLLIHQIDFEIRKNIPPIKLNVHIFDPDPENRMVILNGVKYTSGDSIEDLVSVEEINQAGVVLKFENIKFLIPK